MLSKKTKYAINALAYIAKHGEKKPIGAYLITKMKKRLLMIMSEC